MIHFKPNTEDQAAMVDYVRGNFLASEHEGMQPYSDQWVETLQFALEAVLYLAGPSCEIGFEDPATMGWMIRRAIAVQFGMDTDAVAR